MSRKPAWKMSDASDIIDSRDVEKRIDELTSNAEGAVEDGEDIDPDEADELKALTEFRDEIMCPDWHHGESLIADHYFKEYAMDLAEDIGYPLPGLPVPYRRPAIGRDLQWPACHIDWDAAADALKSDYRDAELDGVTYWARA